MSSAGKEGSIKKWNAWVGQMTDQKFVEMVHRGQLNRKLIAEGCGFDSSILRSNPTVKNNLEGLEIDLRARNILPQLTEKGEKESKGPTDVQVESAKAAREQSRVPGLEQKIVELKAEIASMKSNSERHSELVETHAEWSKY
jgi:hypothetical protein